MAPLPVGQGSKEPARGGVLGVSSATSFFLEFPLGKEKRSQRQSISSGKPLFHYKFYELKNRKNFNEKFEHVEIAIFF